MEILKLRVFEINSLGEFSIRIKMTEEKNQWTWRWNTRNHQIWRTDRKERRKMNRASGTSGKTSRGLTSESLESQKERRKISTRKEIMAKNSWNLVKDKNCPSRLWQAYQGMESSSTTFHWLREHGTWTAQLHIRKPSLPRPPWVRGGAGVFVEKNQHRRSTNSKILIYCRLFSFVIPVFWTLINTYLLKTSSV